MENLRKIIQKVQTSPKSNQDQLTKITFDYDTELVLLKNIAGRILGKTFRIDEYNQQQIIKGLQYFNRDPVFETNGLSLNKGLMVMGNYGTGKTIYMKIFKHYCYVKRLNHQFKIECSEDISHLFAIYGYAGINAFMKNIEEKSPGCYVQVPKNLCIDDLGAERDSVKYFGNDENVMSTVLSARYNLFQKGIFTHITTNLNQTRLVERYGDRLYSRFKEMFNIIILDGEDRRR
jgi:predicted ATPase